MVASSQLGYPIQAAPVNAVQFIWGGTSATAITVDTPTVPLPGQAILVTGTYAGTPLGFNYSTNGGSSYVPALGVALDAFGNYSFPIPAGLAAGTYTIKVQDQTSVGILGTSGSFIITGVNPLNFASGTLIWDMDPNDRTLTYVSGYAGSTGQIATVSNRINPRQYLTAHNGFPVGSPITLVRGSGVDALHTSLGFIRRFSSPLTNYDPLTNQLQAGGLNGPMGSFIRVLSNLGAGPQQAWTAISAVNFNAAGGPVFMAGMLGICIPSNPNRPFIQFTPRYNGPNVGGQIMDATGTAVESDMLTPPPSNGWHVMTTVVGGGTITTRVDKVAGTSNSIAALGNMQLINEFSIGGDGGTTTVLNGASYTQIGRTQLYLGNLTGTDLTTAETLVGASAGFVI